MIQLEALYNILTEFEIPRKLVGLIKMFLNETYSTVHIGKNLSERFSYSELIETRRCFITIVFQLGFGLCHQEGPRKPGRTKPTIEIQTFVRFPLIPDDEGSTHL
jgi:hypothetical protein